MHRRTYFQAAAVAAVFFIGSLPATPAPPPKDSVVAMLAEAHGLKLDWPDKRQLRYGTYWYVSWGRSLVPLPGCTGQPYAQIYSLGDGVSFLVDENTPFTKGVDYARLEADLSWVLDALAKAREKKLQAEFNAKLGITGAMDSPDEGWAAGFNSPQFGPDDLWLEVLRVDRANQFADLRLHGTVETNQYQLLYTNNLIVPGNGWILGAIKYGDAGTNQTDYLNVPISTNSQMFFRAHQANPIISIVTGGQDAIEPNPGISDPGQAGIFYVTANYATNDLAVYYRVSGVASNGVDYTNLSGTVTVPLSTGYAEIDVAPIQDNLAEGSESVTLTLMQTNSYLINPGDVSATVQIWDAAATVSLYLPYPDAYEPNGPPGIPAQPASFEVYRADLRGTFANNLTVFYRITGTASNGVDYSLMSGSVTFLAGMSHTNFDVTPLGDNILEGAETVMLTLIPTNTYMIDTNVMSGTAIVWDSSTTVSVNTAFPGLAIEPNGPPGIAAQVGSFQVSRADSRGESPEMYVFYRVSGTASNGLDYVLSGTLHFATNIFSTNLDVVPLADNILEGPKTVTVTLIATNGYYINTNSASATLAIIDSSTTSSISVVAPGIAIEQDGPPGVPAQKGSFQISRSDSRLKYPDMDVFYRVSGTASNGLDYTLSGVLHFATNAVSTNLIVSPFADNIIEGAETVTVTLIPTNGYYVNANTNLTTATLTIIDSWFLDVCNG